MTNIPTDDSDFQTADPQVEALRMVKRNEHTNILHTRARIEELQERLQQQREYDGIY